MDLIYIVEEGENERYKEKVCRNKIPYISVDRSSEGILYNIDLSFIGARLSEKGKERLKEIGESSESNYENGNFETAFSFLVTGGLDDFHKKILGFITQVGNLESDSSGTVNFNFDKLSSLLGDDTHWQYWKMLQDYANFRKEFGYYKEAYRMSRELYTKEGGSVLDVGSKDVTITIDMFPDSFEKFMLDNDYPEGFEPSKEIVKIKADLYHVNLDRRFNIVFCQQVLEHLENPELAFKKLINFSEDVLVVSVPYGSWHETKWDPINQERVFRWSGMKPKLETIVKDLGVERYLVAYNIKG